MDKSSMFIVLASAICFFSFVAHAQHHNQFIVHGKVYCDTCNVQFVTRISDPMPGAKVRLQCVDLTNAKNITLSKESITNENGLYEIEVEGDHAEEDCQVTLVSSSRDDCAKLDTNKHYLTQAAKISITHHNGITHSPYRVANALGFMKDQPLPECAAVLKELSLNPDGTEIEDN